MDVYKITCRHRNNRGRIFLGFEDGKTPKDEGLLEMLE